MKNACPDIVISSTRSIPPEFTNATFVKFPLYFYMTRERDPLPTPLAKMEVPKEVAVHSAVKTGVL